MSHVKHLCFLLLLSYKNPFDFFCTVDDYGENVDDEIVLHILFVCHTFTFTCYILTKIITGKSTPYARIIILVCNYPTVLTWMLVRAEF